MRRMIYVRFARVSLGNCGQNSIDQRAVRPSCEIEETDTETYSKITSIQEHLSPDTALPPCPFLGIEESLVLVDRSNGARRQKPALAQGIIPFPVASQRRIVYPSRMVSFLYWRLDPRAPLSIWFDSRLGPCEKQKASSHDSSHVHKANITPIYGVPACHIPIYLQAYSFDAIQMAQVCDEETEEHSTPDSDILGRAQDKRFIDSEEEVQI